MTGAERYDPEDFPALQHIAANICGRCLTSVGAECHTPGCMFWAHDVPSEDTAHALRAAVEADDECQHLHQTDVAVTDPVPSRATRICDDCGARVEP